MWYRAIKRLIAQKRTEGLLERVNTMYAVGQLTRDEYIEGIGLLTGVDALEQAEG